MLIGYCDSCRYLDLINEKSECNCPRCSRTLRSLGINSAEWNKLPDEEKYDLSKIADRVGITRSVIVNALRKFESAGVIESRSSGMKGTYIKVLNDVVFDELNEIKKNK